MMNSLIEKLRIGIVTGQLTLSQRECEDYYDMLKQIQKELEENKDV